MELTAPAKQLGTHALVLFSRGLNGQGFSTTSIMHFRVTSSDSIQMCEIIAYARKSTARPAANSLIPETGFIVRCIALMIQNPTGRVRAQRGLPVGCQSMRV
jgi:hypothetical protein